MPLLTPPGCARYPADSSSRVCLHYAKSPTTKAPSIRPLLPLSSIVFSIFMFGHSPLLLCSSYLLHRCIAEKTTATRNHQPDHRPIVREAFPYETLNVHLCLPIFHLLADDWRISRSRGTAICRLEDRSWIKRPDYKRPINLFILFAPLARKTERRAIAATVFSRPVAFYLFHWPRRTSDFDGYREQRNWSSFAANWPQKRNEAKERIWRYARKKPRETRQPRDTTRFSSVR